MQNTTKALADKLRAAADLIAAYPNLPAPCIWAYGSTGRVEINWQVLNGDDKSPESQKVNAKAIIAAVGGTWDKKPWGDRFDFEREYQGLQLQIFAARDAICERVVVGTEPVTVPAVEAQPERVEEREVVEWRCSPLLADDEGERVAS